MPQPGSEAPDTTCLPPLASSGACWRGHRSRPAGPGRGRALGEEAHGRPTVSRGDVDLNRDESAGQPASSPASAPAEEVDYRWVADYQRAEIRSLEARAQELERRLRRRTVALFGALALTGVGAIGAASLAVTPRLEPPPAAALRAAATSDPGAAPAGAVAPEPKAWPTPAPQRP